MTKDFFYIVNGTEFHDTEAFGKAWKEARALAKEEHCEIERVVVYGNEVKYQYYATGGCFLDARFKEDVKPMVF